MQKQNELGENVHLNRPRVKIYIDEPNFYHGLKSMGKKFREFQFDFAKMGRKITTKNRQLIGINYYSTPFKQQRNATIYQEQQKFFARLKKEKINVILCKTKYRIENSNAVIQRSKGTIKGDDISIAVDMLSDAYEDVYDVGILVSSDGDFIPLVKRLISLGKIVELLYFEKLKSWDLVVICNSYREVSKSLLRKCFIPKN
ncbi:MAG: NYN domain-containing protein [Candidatus Lokiarchaeota archaeon]|nr:NYN domain-containing protein [Candidatus Harpocratesius repetitus]